MTLAGKLSIAVLVAATSLTTATASFAQGRGGERFAQIDTNGDGFVTEAEFTAARDTRFAKNDANGDGVIDQDEMFMVAKERAPSAAPEDRIRSRVSKMFEKADANGDGVLQQAELGGPSFSEMLSEADADGDGQLTQEEMSTLKSKRGGIGNRG